MAPGDINPYYGRNRVDESIFAEKPCGETRLSSTIGGKCLEGYKIGDTTSATNESGSIFLSCRVPVTFAPTVKS